MNQTLSIWTDGGARGNPGPSAIGIVIAPVGEFQGKKSGTYIGVGTNNVAEYTALLHALTWVNEHASQIGAYTHITCHLDSQLVVYQLIGKYKIKDPTLATLARNIKQKEREIQKPISYVHIPREQNKEADSIVNQTLDAHI